jgi:hypothetical protein
MTRIGVELDSELNWSLKQYCLNRWRDNPYGHQQQIMRDALTEYLAAHAIKPTTPSKESAYGMSGDGQSPAKTTKKPTAETKTVDNTEIKRLWDSGEHSPTKIAKATGMKRQTVNSRIKAMKKSGELTEEA